MPSTGVYEDSMELLCDQHMKIFEDCIRAVHNVTPEGFTAVKLTALGNPILLERITNALNAIREVYYEFDKDASNVVSLEQFRAGYHSFFLEKEKGEVERWFARMDFDKSQSINYFEWSSTLTLDEIVALMSNARPGTPLAAAALNEQEKGLLKAMMTRLTTLVEFAKAKQVRLMIDAEQTYFQPAIDNLVLELQRKYNRDFPTVWGTYQCYLKNCFFRLTNDMQRAKLEGFWWGAKLVRGAYMTAENKRAQEMGYESPIHDNIENTHKCYNQCIEYTLGKLHRANVLVATHNQVCTCCVRTYRACVRSCCAVLLCVRASLRAPVRRCARTSVACRQP